MEKTLAASGVLMLKGHILKTFSLLYKNVQHFFFSEASLETL